MARAFFQMRVMVETDINPNKNIKAACPVTLLHQDGSGNPYPFPVYSVPSGGLPISNTLTADGLGYVQCYSDVADFVIASYDGTETLSYFVPDPNATVVATGPYPRIDVTTFGAVGDGVHDDRPAIQAAIDSAPASGAVIYFPGGPGMVYLLNSTSGTFSHTDNAGTVTVSYGIQLKSNLTLTSDGATLKRGPALNTINCFMIAATTAVDSVKVERLIIDQDATDVAKNANLGLQGYRSMALWLRYGATNVVLDHVDFIHGGTHRQFQVGTDLTTEAAQSENVRLSFCTFQRSLPGPIQSAGSNANENVTACVLWNTTRATIDHCDFFSTLTGSTAGAHGVAVYAGSSTACGPANPLRDVLIEGCTFRAVQQSAILVRGIPNTAMRGVRILGNHYEDGGKWVSKGFIDVQNLGSGGVNATMYDVVIANNDGRNWGYDYSAGTAADRNAAAGIDVGNDTIVGLIVSGNSLNGSAADGSLPFGALAVPYGRAVGMSLKTSVGVVCDGNSIVNLGGPGIFVYGGTTALVAGGSSRTTISGNTITNCCLKDDGATTMDAGLLLGNFLTDFEVVGNNITNNGSSNAGTQTAAIGFTEEGVADSSTANGVIANNHCRETNVGANRKQQYGIRLGNAPGGTLRRRPFRLTVVGNDCTNNVTAGIFADTTYGTNTRSYHLENNRGHLAVDPVASSILGAIGFGTSGSQDVTIPGATVGDHATVAADCSFATGLILTAQVAAANTVRVMLLNSNTSGSLTPNGGTAYNWRIRVAHRNLA